MRLFFAVLIMLISAAGTLAVCVDTDGGQDFATKGTTTYYKSGRAVAENTDICTDENTLVEYFCDTDGKTTIAYKLCRCVDGACTDAEKKPAIMEGFPEEEPVEEEPEVPVEEEAPIIINAWLLIFVIAIVAVAGYIILKKEEFF